MKILIIGFAKIKYMPYIHFYLDRMDVKAHEVHILKWNRDFSPDVSAPSDVVLHSFEYPLEDEIGKIQKIIPFLCYRAYALKIMRKYAFDSIIVLNSLPGLLLSGFLNKKYKGRFILDYRDFTYENILVFRRKVGVLSDNAFATFVSSDKYRDYLPKSDNVFTSHNISNETMEHLHIGQRVKKKPLIISFWGLIRHFEINEKLIMKIGNDSRFELHYYGREQDTAHRLKELTGTLNISNVFFHGEYRPQDRFKFVKNTMIVHNLYNRQDQNTNMAMGNKYYDAVVFGIPQLCTKGSYMGSRISELGIGMECDIDSEDFVEDVLSYYNSIDWDVFLTNCDCELQSIKRDLDIATKVVTSFVNDDVLSVK